MKISELEEKQLRLSYLKNRKIKEWRDTEAHGIPSTLSKLTQGVKKDKHYGPEGVFGYYSGEFCKSEGH